MKLSVVIPAYNEEDRIVRTLTETLSWLDDQEYNAEILVVSDGSRDATGKVVSEFSDTDRVQIRFLEYFPNRGKGYAVRYGMLRAEGEFVLFMDADYSVPASYIRTALELVENGYDAAIASRALSDSCITQHQSFFRELSGKLYTLVQNTYLGFRYPDTQCGFKIFSKKACQSLFSRQKLHSVIFDPEILYLARRSGYRVGQFPVDWTHQEDSRIQYDSIKKSLFVFQELFRIRSLHR